MTERVVLLDVDSTIPNLALMKLSAWHRAAGDVVALNDQRSPTRVYGSCVFTWGRPRLERYRSVFPEMIVGGGGVEIASQLSHEVESLQPDYRLYWDRAPRWRGVGFGFLQRGCIRSCSFCIVPKKEGKPFVVAELDDLINSDWQETGWRRPFVVLLDNNFLSLGQWTLDTLDEMADRQIDVCFSQGLDIRLVTPEIAAKLADVRFWNLHHTSTQMTFAFDHVGIERPFREGVARLVEAGIKPWKLQSFVLCGFNSTLEQDYHRVQVIRSLGIDPFVMVYRDPATGKMREDRQLRHFARWVNRRLYNVCAWEDYAPWAKASLQSELPVVCPDEVLNL